ncbi:DUF3618 domain-containing protein [Haloechinothrix salitolerans]|uniref:DUF3618 domain-containing protein n=1 Tax=Haloechinothrix salitolerans TaxID=926830 RepID=A0ABW2C8K0_9PSEU
MVRDQEAIKRDIEKHRDALASNIDQLSVRMSPKRLADDAKTTAKNTFDEPKVKYPVIAVVVLIVLLLLRKLLR